MPSNNSNNANPTQTIEITNLGGGLTRKLNGDMNSGQARYATSFGYDPFSKPGNLTWLENPIDADPSGSSIAGMIVAAKTRIENGAGYLYAIDHIGTFYKITPNNTLNSANLSAVSVLSRSTDSLLTNFTLGSGMEFWGNGTAALEQVYVGGDTGIEKMNFDGSAHSIVGTTSSSSVVQNVSRSLQQFAGNLYFANGTNIGQIGAASIVNSYQQLSPPLPPGMVIRDMETSSDLNYLLILASFIPASGFNSAVGDRLVASSGDSYIFQWNGTDIGITAGVRFPSFVVSGIHSFLDKQIYTSMDSIGANIINGGNKEISLPNVKPAAANANAANGNMFTFASVEKFNNSMQASLFYYGQFDTELPAGLWRLCSQGSTQTNGWIMQVPWQIVYSGMQPTTDNASSVLATIEGKHMFSALDVSNGAGTSKFKLYVMPLPPTGTGTPQLGVYETQTQLFSKKITIKQIRVYTEPTAANQGFQIDCIGSDGSIIVSTGSWTNTYTYTAGTDPTIQQGSLERINFNPVIKDTYALGIRITNTGTANMVIHKIEVDYAQSGK